MKFEGEHENFILGTRTDGQFAVRGVGVAIIYIPIAQVFLLNKLLTISTLTVFKSLCIT